MPDAVVTIVGLDELQRKMRASDAALARALGPGLQAGAQVVSRDAKHRVPVWTGKLQRSLGPGKVEGSGKDQLIRVGIRPGFGAPSRGRSIKGQSRKAREAMPWNRGEPRVYGPFVERGTRRMHARPYLVPALTENEREVTRRIFERVEDVLRSIARR